MEKMWVGTGKNNLNSWAHLFQNETWFLDSRLNNKLILYPHGKINTFILNDSSFTQQTRFHGPGVKWATNILVQMWCMLGHCQINEWFQVSMQVSHQCLLENQIYYIFYVYMTGTRIIFIYIEDCVWPCLSSRCCTDFLLVSFWCLDQSPWSFLILFFC